MCFWKKKKVKVNVCADSSWLPREGAAPPLTPACRATVEREYDKGSEPKLRCDWVSNIEVCADNGKRPNPPWCPRTEYRSLHFGTEPVDVCAEHVKPPDPVKKCRHPFHDTDRLIIFSDGQLSTLAMKETAEWPDARLPELLDAYVEDGINARRNCSTIAPGDPNDPLDYWRFGDAEYLPVIKHRLDLIKERDLTEIIVLKPYGMGITDDEARTLIRELKPYLPNVILEMVNEPGCDNWQRHLAELALAEGWPLKYLALEYVHHCGSASDLILELTPNGEAIVSYHWIGSMETVGEIWRPEDYPGSDSWRLIKMGFFGSNDGQDQKQAALGLKFWLHCQPATFTDEYRRSSPEQLHDVSKWMWQNGAIGFEDLSASALLRSASPNMDDAISIGRAERLAMAQAYEEVFG
jgi:hypothetical protein